MRYFEQNHEYGRQQNKSTNLWTDAVAFETVNGESVAVYYNPLCKEASGEKYRNFTESTLPFMCANFIYDLNGKKGPNKVGKDIGVITALYPTEPNVVAPISLMYINNAIFSFAAAEAACQEKNENSRVPNVDEMTAMFYNKIILGIQSSAGFWSSSIVSSELAWAVWHNTNDRGVLTHGFSAYVWCIKR